jgi:hypothetical protein
MCQILYESYKFVNVIIISRLLPIADSAHLVCIRMQTLMVDHMAETVYLLGVKFTFLLFEVELELADLIKHKREMFLVLVYRITVHKQIIKIGMQEYAYKISKDHRHHALECGGGVTVPNLHCMAHVCAIYHCECTLVYVLGHCTNLFVRVGEVDLQPYLCSRYI